MKFEKVFLILLGSVFTIVLSTAAHAAEKIGSMEAVWDAINKPSSAKSITKNPAPRKQIAHADNALMKNADAKLVRQRAIWRAKWEAQQLAKKQKNAAFSQPHDATNRAAVRPAWKQVPAAPTKTPVRQVVKKQPPKP